MSTCNAMLCPALKLVTGADDQHQPHRRHDPLLKYTLEVAYKQEQGQPSPVTFADHRDYWQRA
jgi:hypothetical protein